jgi:hypothetical protein
VPALAQLSASVEGYTAGPGVALGLFNISWAISQVAGALGGAALSHVGAAVPFRLLGTLFLAGMRAA